MFNHAWLQWAGSCVVRAWATAACRVQRSRLVLMGGALVVWGVGEPRISIAAVVVTCAPPRVGCATQREG